MVMTLWAIIMVELVNPVVQEVADRGGWTSCDRCRRAFASVFMANLTLLQTVIAGDSWGFMAVPVIEAAPWTSTVFMGALLTLVCGVMNIIVAVLVDTFAEGRAKDLLRRAQELDMEEVQEKAILSKIFHKMDRDKSGSVSIPELEEGARRVEDFRNWLRVMDIDARDLKQLFVMVDEDNSGEIDQREFVEAMYRMRNAETKTTTKFVKYIVMKMELEMRKVNQEMGRLDRGLHRLLKQVGELRRRNACGRSWRRRWGRPARWPWRRWFELARHCHWRKRLAASTQRRPRSPLVWRDRRAGQTATPTRRARHLGPSPGRRRIRPARRRSSGQGSCSPAARGASQRTGPRPPIQRSPTPCRRLLTYSGTEALLAWREGADILAIACRRQSMHLLKPQRARAARARRL